MTSDALQAWLKRKIALKVAGCWLGAALTLAGGAGVLFLTFWFAYAVLWFGELGVSALSDLVLGRRLQLTHGWRLVLCGGLVLALFREWLRRSEWDLGRYGPVAGGPCTNALVHRAGAMGALAVLLANPQASASLITELLYTGPRLVLGAGHLVGQARRLRRVEQPACAWVLEYLLGRDRAVTYAELGAAWPEADWEGIRADLACLPGIVFLEKGPRLTSELREELLRLPKG